MMTLPTRAAVVAALAAGLFGATPPANAAPAPSAPQVLKTTLTAPELSAVLADAGLAADVSEDPQSGLSGASSVNGAGYTVRALNCHGAPRACSTLIFYANFDLGRQATAADFSTINHFNDSEVFGRAYVIPAKNQIGVDYVVELGGGVTPEHLTSAISRWRGVVGAFLAKFGANGASS